jgi:hypothetical protein
MSEENWTRIVEAARTLGQIRNVAVPVGLVRSTGNIWQRNAQRKAALAGFLVSIGKDHFEMDLPLPVMADVMDELALEAMEARLTAVLERPKPKAKRKKHMRTLKDDEAYEIGGDGMPEVVKVPAPPPQKNADEEGSKEE